MFTDGPIHDGLGRHRTDEGQRFPILCVGTSELRFDEAASDRIGKLLGFCLGFFAGGFLAFRERSFTGADFVLFKNPPQFSQPGRVDQQR